MLCVERSVKHTVPAFVLWILQLWQFRDLEWPCGNPGSCEEPGQLCAASTQFACECASVLSEASLGADHKQKERAKENAHP